MAQVIELMEENSKDEVGSNFAERGAMTLCATRGLLQQQQSDQRSVKELNVNVPLLGNIHIRRNLPASESNQLQDQSKSVAAQSTSWQTQTQMVPASYNPQLAAGTYIQGTHFPITLDQPCNGGASIVVY